MAVSTKQVTLIVLIWLLTCVQPGNCRRDGDGNWIPGSPGEFRFTVVKES